MAKSQTTMRVESNLVLVNAAVRDRNGHFAGGLKAEDFRLLDDGSEQRITSFSQADVPVSIAVVFDASNSMKSTLPAIKSALPALLGTANPADEFAAVVVRDRPEGILQFTQDPRELLERLDSLAADGRTALRDSIYVAAQGLRSAHNRRRAIVVISDGLDNRSRYKEKELKRMLQETDVTIYTVGLFRAFPEDQAELGRLLLSDIAELTGGRYVLANSPKDIGKAIRDLDVRNQYVIGFSPSGPPSDGRYHRVNLKLNSPGRAASLRLSWRRGYYAAGGQETASHHP